MKKLVFALSMIAFIVPAIVQASEPATTDFSATEVSSADSTTQADRFFLKGIGLPENVSDCIGWTFTYRFIVRGRTALISGKILGVAFKSNDEVRLYVSVPKVDDQPLLFLYYPQYYFQDRDGYYSPEFWKGAGTEELATRSISAIGELTLIPDVTRSR